MSPEFCGRELLQQLWEFGQEDRSATEVLGVSWTELARWLTTVWTLIPQTLQSIVIVCPPQLVNLIAFTAVLGLQFEYSAAHWTIYVHAVDIYQEKACEDGCKFFPIKLTKWVDNRNGKQCTLKGTTRVSTVTDTMGRFDSWADFLMSCLLGDPHRCAEVWVAGA
jgi:hypothetical protein